METVVVKPGGKSNRAYPVAVGPGILAEISQMLKVLSAETSSKKAFLIADRRLAQAAQVLAKQLRKAGWQVEFELITVSEKAKDYRRLFPIFGRLIEAKMDRHSLIFGIGGGVIGDLAGFVAATYLRGIAWVGVPTTLLAQVDSAVGGKTGVNHPLGKNLIGAFHQPSLVIADTELLKSLSARDRISGFSEMLKTGLIFDAGHFKFLCENRSEILALNPKILTRAISKTVAWKADVVRRDEYETTGLRQILNFGHTLGHALETITDYKKYRHGEAVAWGMRFACALSMVRGHLSEKKYREIDAELRKLPLPPLPSALSVGRIASAMKHDKKVKAGRIYFVLLKDLGKSIIDSQVKNADLAKALALVKKI